MRLAFGSALAAGFLTIAGAAYVRTEAGPVLANGATPTPVAPTAVATVATWATQRGLALGMARSKFSAPVTPVRVPGVARMVAPDPRASSLGLVPGPGLAGFFGAKVPAQVTPWPITPGMGNVTHDQSGRNMGGAMSVQPSGLFAPAPPPVSAPAQRGLSTISLNQMRALAAFLPR